MFLELFRAAHENQGVYAWVNVDCAHAELEDALLQLLGNLESVDEKHSEVERSPAGYRQA